MKIIDCRIRPPFKSVTKVLAVFANAPAPVLPLPVLASYDPAPSQKEPSMDLFWEEYDDAGFDASILVGRQAAQNVIDNDDLHALWKQQKKRFPRALAGIDAAKACSNIMATCDYIRHLVKEQGFTGIVMDPGWCLPPIKVDDRRLYPIYATCAELGCIMYSTMSLMQTPGDLSYTDPCAIHRVATDFPTLQIVIVHNAHPFSAQLIGIMMNNAPYGNIWALLDFFQSIPGFPGAREWIDAANGHLVDERLVWGSGYPVRSLEAAKKQFLELPFKDDVMEKIMYKNAQNLFGFKL
ncbi:amidohydrolase family protein [Desulfolutivibrio sulfoxidireducens]|uniref:amidohydrolase family protein n=1 Tax=Desulfolutivibrio sulfoxidireducens TaxID=2773299 RepID=UPI00159E6D7F|nr:amidohydrolase family protein [Desulfolutivibrio sulfoxidireducens]QLA18189.1 amidohydrolase family protein [Desulfolutivibrio sulfoxidireducens]